MWKNIKSGPSRWDRAAQRWGEAVSVDVIRKLTLDKDSKMVRETGDGLKYKKSSEFPKEG